LQFSGERAAALEKQFVHQFPLRASGQPNSPRAAAWLKGQLIKKGWKCQIDSWEVVNYSKPVTLRNVVAMLPGKSTREIVVMAHHDQSPATVEGADNDGSGISLLLHLSEIFGTEQPLPYTLVFVATDGEEGQVLIMV
jgi:alkaline phosphatase isozyme conversion protein